MTRLSRAMVQYMVGEWGPGEVLARLADPYWFQAFGCVLGFDWHSSGVTTTVCGALKEGLKGLEGELGLFVCGGKGAVSRRTPQEIENHGARYGLPASAERLVYASRMSAKVDNTAVQDGYQLYHHCFIFTRDGAWAVVQQGMNPEAGWARRYHWLASPGHSFVNEPHAAVCAEHRGEVTLNMVAAEAETARRVAASLANEHPEALLREIQRMRELVLPRRHQLLLSDLHPKSLHPVLLRAYEAAPSSFQQVLEVQGVGPKAVRALALIAEVLHGAPLSHRDPARYAFAHGGKDGTPFPVDRKTYDHSIRVLQQTVESARLGKSDRVEALRRLAAWSAKETG
jgi:hypothetical protein